MTQAPSEPPSVWSDALLAAAVLAVDPDGLGGIHVRARSGLVRDSWLEHLALGFGPDAPKRRIAAGMSQARLSGGLDIGATLQSGRPVVERGVLAAVDGGLLVVAMAERLDLAAAATIGIALDERTTRIERDGISSCHPARFALVALDESVAEDEILAPALCDRLGLTIDLDGVGWREAEDVAGRWTFADIAEAKARLPSVSLSDAMVEALCGAALAFGGPSMRASLHLLRAARAAAALRGAVTVETEDAATALRLVMGLQSSATQERADEEEEAEELARPDPPEPSPQDAPSDQAADAQQPLSAEALQDMIVAAVSAILPKHLLGSLEAGAALRTRQGSAGKAGAARQRGTRGRAIGTVDRPPTPGARLDVLATLRQAAPWQRIRARDAGEVDAGQPKRLHVRRQDFRYARYRDKTGTTAIFAVDASGSAAVERLAETKGAIELLLAECYVRRDSVALIAFRGSIAETLLEPTRSLVRAKRSLSALPGGGGTPLAGGILAALGMAGAVSRKGQSAVAVFLTDGRGNVALDGTTEKALVTEDTARAARRFKIAGVRAILIDTAQRPQARARDLAKDLGAEYLALPRGGSNAMAREIGARMEG